MRLAEAGIGELQQSVDTLIVIPNQNLFRVANEKTTFADAFAMADQVLYSGVACITDLMVKEGLINLDFADVRAVMRGMGKAMMGTGEASGEKRAIRAAEAAIANPLLDDVSMKRRARPPHLDHRRQRPHALRGRRGRNPHPRGGRSGRQHHPRRDLRREPRRHHPRVGRGDRHRSGLDRQRPRHLLDGAADLRGGRASARRSARAGDTAAPRGGLDRTQATPEAIEAGRRAVQSPKCPRLSTRARQSIRASRRADDVVLTPTQSEAGGRLRAAATEQAVEEDPMPDRHLHPAGPADRASSARRACRASRSCRCRHRTRSAPAAASEPAPDQKRMTLLQRLATVGFGRREETPTHVQPPPAPAPRAAPEAPRPQMSPVHAEYAKRPATPQGYRPARVSSTRKVASRRRSRIDRGGSARDPGLPPPPGRTDRNDDCRRCS